MHLGFFFYLYFMFRVCFFQPYLFNFLIFLNITHNEVLKVHSEASLPLPLLLPK